MYNSWIPVELQLPSTLYIAIAGTRPSVIGSELFYLTNEREGYCSARMTFVEAFWAPVAVVAAVINVRLSRH